MDLKGLHKFYEALGSALEEMGIEFSYVNGAGEPQIGDTMRILFPVTEDGHIALTEVLVTEYTEDLDLLMLYTTLVVELNEKAAELPEKLLGWNLTCPLGAYGVYEEEKQLYHKYTMPFDRDGAAEDLANDAVMLLELLFDVFSAQYEEYIAYSEE